MRFLRIAALACLAGLLLGTNAMADEWNKKTILTVNEPIRLPSCCNAEHSVTLQPGEYVMVLVDSLSDRHIVRVYDKDQKKVITTALAIPNYRLKPTSKTAFQYWEVAKGEAPPMRAWFYPGDNFGQEFAYPKEVATTITTAVPVANATSEEELKTSKLEVTEPESYVAPKTEPAPEPAAKTEPEPAQVPAPKTEPEPAPTPQAPAQEPAPAPEQKTLPSTASPMPLIGLIGLLSSAGAVVLRFKRSK